MSHPVRDAGCDTCGDLFVVTFKRGHNNSVSCDTCMGGEDYRKLADKNSQLKYKYGIPLFVFTALLLSQNSVCQICGEPVLPSFRSASVVARKDEACVDHCHATGKVRGILCHICNVSLGKVRDKPEVLDRMAAYLRKND